MRKRVLACLMMAFAIVGACVAMWLVWEKQPITRATYDQVCPGMTEEEVMRLIPIPDGYHIETGDNMLPELVAQDGKGHFQNKDVVPKKVEDGSVQFFAKDTGELVGWFRTWRDRRYRLDVIFNPDGRVRGRTLYKWVPADPPTVRYSRWTFGMSAGGPSAAVRSS